MSWPAFLACLAQNDDVVNSFSTRFSIECSQTVYPTPHHVALLRCGWSRFDVEDVELQTCWIGLLKVFSY